MAPTGPACSLFAPGRERWMVFSLSLHMTFERNGLNISGRFHPCSKRKGARAIRLRTKSARLLKGEARPEPLR